MGKTLYDKVFDEHCVREVSPGQYQLYIALHLVHEATSAPAFEMLRERGLKLAAPERTFGTVDHVIPTNGEVRPYSDTTAEALETELEKNAMEFKFRYFSSGKKENGVVHVIGPEKGLTWPASTIACGDSHTSTHGAFGAVAFGVGTSQVRDILATQTVIMPRLRVKKVEITGRTPEGVTAKDVVLYVISKLGTRAGAGFAYEFAGQVIEKMTMEERMTVCNMAVEAGARVGYINPDETTFAYLRSRAFAPDDFESAVTRWKTFASDKDAEYSEVVSFDVSNLSPMVTWGTNPAQAVFVSDRTPESPDRDDADALAFMGFSANESVAGRRIDVAFIGSCTNGRLSDLEAAADVVRKARTTKAAHVKAVVVPGSHNVYNEAVALGLDRVFTDAGFEFRQPGCSMCLAMNSDKLEAGQVCASSSNRNFKGRQGSPTGRTLLMSPAMVAAAALRGYVCDVREFTGGVK
ncbi:MAG TPA: 3-isopropylmalate dehydratase large subunit [Leptospiraceae bacterium]|nr:3-isopropylmalate dehydratase large subunit [Leptospirales bacterium]HMX57849.1 3-isopropylmalate dehydratase large subunit [Leptospiraceae bacterium]HMZ35576.1 3-isopropylmalate dehydratase large subunit [Leptospiraceae bacterium]HNL68397.1 3-isopropylmalate dehydratase large subunit [Leptospiraceae bacterium]HNN58684.1 3-isopropylmalate dehydratase large subunit [Leptospiraceae bacterium]